VAAILLEQYECCSHRLDVMLDSFALMHLEVAAGHLSNSVQPVLVI
jgi:hypothetical protein